MATVNDGAPSRRRLTTALAIVTVVVAGALSAWRIGVFSPTTASAESGGPGGNQAAATAPVTRQEISAVTPVNATLEYAGSYVVRGQGDETLTWLPPPGRVIRQGQVLYRTDNASPVVLLYGQVPAWRPLLEGLVGQDVSQLNHDLVALGDADRADIATLDWDYFSWATAAGVERLQSALGISDPSGVLALGQIVFEPGALRVSQATASLGEPESGPVLAATSSRPVVVISLSVSQQSQVKTGDAVSVTLPDGATTAGTISAIGRVATGSGSNATIRVQVRLARPSVAGSLDHAPVTVNITTSTAREALVVPVTALLAQAANGTNGKYVVEVVGPGNARRWVPVTPGIFDDASGLVQVSGALTPGQRVVVPAS
jgi:hypothetical protein